MSFKISISLLDLVNIREGENIRSSILNSINMAQDAEKLGFNRFWLAEHHNMPSIASTSTALLINMVADKTKQIRVGSGGIMLPNHSPLSVAESFGTLSHMHPNRIDLGLGRAPGTDGPTAAALRKNFIHAPYDFKENIEELQSYIHNTHDAQRVRAYIAEGQDIPIWILGSSTDSAYLAAEMGLPYAFAAHFAPTYLPAAVKIYKDNFKPSTYLAQPYFMACVNIIAADTDAEANYLATTLQQMFLGIITNTRSKMPKPISQLDELLGEDIRQAIQHMLYFTFVGSPSSLSTQLQAFIQQYQVDELMTTNYIFDLDKRAHALHLIKSLFE